MLWVFLQLFSGFFTTALGVFLAYFYVTGADNGRSIFLMIPAMLCVAGGVILLLKAGKQENNVLFAPPKEVLKETNAQGGGLQETLAKNGKIVAEWNKTNEDKDKLHLLQIAAQAAEGKPGQ